MDVCPLGYFDVIALPDEAEQKEARLFCLMYVADRSPVVITPRRAVEIPLLPQVLMAIDDSESMSDCGAGALALAAMTTVASGLTQLEAGQLAVAR